MIILSGKSKKGKSRIKQFGEEWDIVGEHTSTEKWLLRSKNTDSQGSDDLRWVFMNDDPDFNIERESD
jgi:hypothetical protein